MAAKTPIIGQTADGATMAPIGDDEMKAGRKERIARAKANKTASDVTYMPIKRAGIGKLKKDGRRSGGMFSAKELLIATIDNLKETETRDHEVIDLQKCRILLVPLHMEYTDYPTIQEDEVVMREREAMYATEDQRDLALSKQVDPHWYPGKLFPGTKREMKTASLGFGRFDPMWRNDEPGAGRSFGGGVMGQAAKIEIPA